MKCVNLGYNNLKLKTEFCNDVYDVVGEAIDQTVKKHKYKKYDVFKLVAAIYSGKYGYITAKNDYRKQVELLDLYFRKKYNCSIIIFEMIKTLKALQDTENYSSLVLDIANIETIIRTGKKEKPKNPMIFSNYIQNEQYEELIKKIENENSLRYAIMIVYDKIKIKNK